MPSYLQVRLLHVYFEVFVCLVSYLLTFYVIYLGIYKMNRRMKAFRLIIFLTCFVELIYNTATLFCQPVGEITGGVLFLMNSGPFEHASDLNAVIMMSIWLFSMFLMIVNTAMVFLYRYKILCQQQTFTMRKFWVIYVILVTYSAVHSSCCLVTAQTDLNENNYKEMLFKTKLFAENTPTPIIFNAMRLKSFLQLADSQVIMFFCYSIILYSGYKIHKCLVQSKDQMSKQTISVQSQLTKIMLLQAIYPMLDMVLPVSICCFGAFFNLTIPFVGVIIGTTMSLIPVINSLIIIWIIPSFRRATLRLLCLKRFEAKVAASSSFIQVQNRTDLRRLQVSSVSASASPQARGPGTSTTLK